LTQRPTPIATSLAVRSPGSDPTEGGEAWVVDGCEATDRAGVLAWRNDVMFWLPPIVLIPFLHTR
jgi:hypothetical protein